MVMAGVMRVVPSIVNWFFLRCMTAVWINKHQPCYASVPATRGYDGAVIDDRYDFNVSSRPDSGHAWRWRGTRKL